MDQPKSTCCWCKQAADDPKYHAIVLGRTLPFCQEDYLMFQQLFANIPQLFKELSKHGIQIGVPRR